MLMFAKADTKVATYDTYKECYEKVLSKSSSSSDDANVKKVKKAMASFVNGGGFSLLNDFETKYDCAGFCKTPLFYVTKSVNLRPSKECIRPIVKNLSEFAYYIGFVALISFFANFCGFCGSFSLCTKMEGNEDE